MDPSYNSVWRFVAAKWPETTLLLLLHCMWWKREGGKSPKSLQALLWLLGQTQSVSKSVWQKTAAAHRMWHTTASAQDLRFSLSVSPCFSLLARSAIPLVFAITTALHFYANIGQAESKNAVPLPGSRHLVIWAQAACTMHCNHRRERERERDKVYCPRRCKRRARRNLHRWATDETRRGRQTMDILAPSVATKSSATGLGSCSLGSVECEPRGNLHGRYPPLILGFTDRAIYDLVSHSYKRQML